MLCFGNLEKRGLAGWRVIIAIFLILSSTGVCKPTNSRFDEDSFSPSSSPSSSSSSTLSQRKTLNQEIGSPSELAWRAWLLVENKGGGQSALDSSNILRRITPKSIFIAPELVSCPSGYSLDGKNGCKPDPISIDEDAQRQFLLKRLNILYGKNGNNRKKPPETTGPLQINIPFSLPAKVNPPEKQPVQQPQLQQPVQKPDQQTIAGDQLAIPVVISQQAPIQQQNENHDSVAVVVYKVTNNTKKDGNIEENRTTQSSSISSDTSSFVKNPQTVGHVVPVAEIVEEANETFSGIVNYKIPVGPRPTHNKSNIYDESMSDSKLQPSEKKVDELDSSEEFSPAVVLLLSPTNLPSTVSSRKEYGTLKTGSFDRLTTRQEPVESLELMEHENTTILETEDETKFETDTTIQTVSPLRTETAGEQVGTTLTSTEKSFTGDRFEEETAYTDEETQTEPVSDDHEEYDDTTREMDQDDSGEGEDELLKPGEAGMMISTKNQDFIQSKTHKHRTSTTLNAEETASTMLGEATTTETIPTADLQNTFIASESTVKIEPTSYTKVGITSTQTTEIPSTIISTEFGVEDTTALATQPLIIENSMKSTTRSHPTQIPTTTIVDGKEKTDGKEFSETEKDLVTEPEVILSTQGSHSLTTSYEWKRPTNPIRITETAHIVDELQDEISKTELPPLTDFHRQLDYRRPKPPIIVNNEPIHFKNDGNIPSEFKEQIINSPKPALTDFRRIPSSSMNDEATYVRFPEQSPEMKLQQQSYVRFPSDEVNSIHNQDNYKDHLLLSYHTRDEYSNNAPTSTKSSVPARQKSPSTQWRVPPSSIRMDRQHQQSQPQQTQGNSNNASQRQQKQKPMLLRFWRRMPLVRDLSFYPTTSHGSHNEPIGGQDETHRSNSRFFSATPPTARRANYYKEISSHDINRLLAQQLGQSAIGG